MGGWALRDEGWATWGWEASGARGREMRDGGKQGGLQRLDLFIFYNEILIQDEFKFGFDFGANI